MTCRIEALLRANDDGGGRAEETEWGARAEETQRPALSCRVILLLSHAPTPFLLSFSSLFGRSGSAAFYIWKTFNKDGVRKPGSEAPG